MLFVGQRMSQMNTTDEMMWIVEPLCGRCGFHVYMHNKSHKCGIKINHMFGNGIGLTLEEQNLSKPKSCIMAQQSHSEK